MLVMVTGWCGEGAGKRGQVAPSHADSNRMNEELSQHALYLGEKHGAMPAELLNRLLRSRYKPVARSALASQS